MSQSIDLIALLVAVAAFIIGLVQYRKAQKWKKAEFVAQEFKQFEADPVVADALTLLDWNPMYTALSVTGPSADKCLISHEDISSSLRRHTQVPEGFEPPFSDIRRTFDVFFSKLGRFHHYIKAGLVEKEDIDPYLDYWMDALCARGRIVREETCMRIWDFLIFYDYRDVEGLLRIYGCDIRSSGAHATAGLTAQPG